jgi:hypothetical protein
MSRRLQNRDAGRAMNDRTEISRPSEGEPMSRKSVIIITAVTALVASSLTPAKASNGYGAERRWTGWHHQSGYHPFPNDHPTLCTWC